MKKKIFLRKEILEKKKTLNLGDCNFDNDGSVLSIYLIFCVTLLKQCRDRNVAKTSSDVLAVLCDHVDKFLDFHPDLPTRIVNVRIPLVFFINFSGVKGSVYLPVCWVTHW